MVCERFFHRSTAFDRESDFSGKLSDRVKNEMDGENASNNRQIDCDWTGRSGDVERKVIWVYVRRSVEVNIDKRVTALGDTF